MYDSYGWLSVRVETGGSYPVSGAIVRIRGAEDQNKNIMYSLITNRDGLTDTVELPAPQVDESTVSFSPDNYSTYDLEIYAENYFPKRIYGVTVFSEIESIQVVSMIPSDDDPGTIPYGELSINLNS